MIKYDRIISTNTKQQDSFSGNDDELVVLEQNKTPQDVH